MNTKSFCHKHKYALIIEQPQHKNCFQIFDLKRGAVVALVVIVVVDVVGVVGVVVVFIAFAVR